MKYYNVELVRTEDRSFSFRFFTNTEIEQLVSQVCISRKKSHRKKMFHAGVANVGRMYMQPVDFFLFQVKTKSMPCNDLRIH